MAFRRLFVILFAIVGSAVVIDPELLTRVAASLGIGRGADLLLYALCIAFLGSLAMHSRRVSELSRRNTLVNRRVALLEAELALRDSRESVDVGN